MIKINLLAEGRPKVAKPKKAGAGLSDEPANLWLIVLLVVGLLVVAGRFFLLQRTISQKRVEIAAVQKEVDELAPIIREVEQFEAEKALLEHKISVINTLKDNQRGPVSIMDAISRSLPEMLWLTRMQAKGNTITLNGQAFNTNAVANFMDNLDHVEAFNEPVLRDTAQRRGRQGAGARAAAELYNFVVTFSFDPSAIKTKDESQAAAEAAG